MKLGMEHCIIKLHSSLIYKQHYSYKGLLSANNLLCTRHAEVSLEMFPPDERLATDSTFEWSLPSVCTRMSLKTFLKRELLPAHITLERFLSSVGYRMLLQIIVTGKLFSTNHTTIRFLASMDAVMLSKIPL